MSSGPLVIQQFVMEAYDPCKFVDLPIKTMFQIALWVITQRVSQKLQFLLICIVAVNILLKIVLL